VVDIDLQKFFDRVNQDILMGLVAERVSDRGLLRLIRGFLTAGVLADGWSGRPTKEPARGSALALAVEPGA
jgi:RNA-directed DNA polymerase